jgi:DNA-binding response OmpR family regulator
MVRLCLESENIVCKTTEDRKEGLQWIKEDKFDAILLDLAIPEFSGFDIFRALKEENLLQSDNVLIFTASSVSDQELTKRDVVFWCKRSPYRLMT